MSKEEIYGADGTLRAVIYTSGSRLELYSNSGQLLAIYSEETNETRDASGSLVGRGNQLLTCL